jgi:hypothetical protein
MRTWRDRARGGTVLLACLALLPGLGAPPEPAGARALAQAKGSGTLTIGDATTYSFNIARCDLSGSAEDGILLRGNGGAPDGGRLSVEVERLKPPIGVGMIYERVTLVLLRDGVREGEWEATRNSHDHKRWFRKEGAEAADGPLLRISGAELVAADTYTYERAMSRRELDIQREMTRRETTPERRRELDAERRSLRKQREAAGDSRPGTLRATCAAT